MRLGIVALVLGYTLSQFYRACLAVLTPQLQAELQITSTQLGDASGLWFLLFALMQIPIGFALDRVGPRRTAAVLHLLGGAGGALLFALAQSPAQIIWAMGLIGIGCAPVLMASLYIFARLYSPVMFGTLSGILIAVGNLGNLGAALPLSLAVEAFGWRGTVLVMAGVTAVVALMLWTFVKDPPKAEAGPSGEGLWQILKSPAVWAILAMLLTSYAPAAAIRGLWAGPYFAKVFGATAADIGVVTLIMGIAMILGNIAYGSVDRLLGSRKWGIMGGTLAGLALLAGLWWQPHPPYVVAVACVAGIGFFGMCFPQLMAHGRAFFPPHLVGRGVTLLNFFGIGGVGLFQMLSGRVFAHGSQAASAPPQAFSLLFGFFALVVALGCLAYAFAQDRLD